jgi:hypothetical protein
MCLYERNVAVGCGMMDLGLGLNRLWNVMLMEARVRSENKGHA